jgi:hypothetical protein
MHRGEEPSIEVGAGRDQYLENQPCLGNIHLAAALCLLAASGSLCVLATSSVVAKQKSVAPTMKQKSITPIDETPTNKRDCLDVPNALWAGGEPKRTKQIIPREFVHVASNLDEFCGAENFEKGRISIDWMNTCLKNFTKDYKLGFKEQKLFLCN